MRNFFIATGLSFGLALGAVAMAGDPPAEEKKEEAKQEDCSKIEDAAKKKACEEKAAAAKKEEPKAKGGKAKPSNKGRMESETVDE